MTKESRQADPSVVGFDDIIERIEIPCCCEGVLDAKFRCRPSDLPQGHAVSSR